MSTESKRNVWFRGEHCNFNPDKAQLQEANAIDEYFIKGWAPPEPIIHEDTTVLTFGSCFARHLRSHLTKRNVKQHSIKYKRVPVIHASAGLNTTFVLRQQFEWAWTGRKFDEALWFDEAQNELPALEEYKELTRQAFNETDVFVLTLGLSEIWYSKVTGDAFMRAIPTDHHDPELHGFRVTTVQENLDNLNRILELGKKYRPKAKWVFTLSPVPLIATFRPVSCITANSVSKSILRVAVDELMRQHEGEPIYYWPSYEIIQARPDAYKEDNRHITSEAVEMIMDRFDHYYISMGEERYEAPKA